jgi:hypothetical protein
MAGAVNDKASSVLWAQRHYPGVDLRRTARCKNLHDGMADALAIAEYCRRLHGGQKTPDFLN